MFRRAWFFAVSVLILSTLSLVLGCGASKKEGANAPTATVSPTGNIQSSIQSVSIAGPPVVTFTLFDQTGAPLDPNAVIAGGGRVRFFIAQIGADGNYKNYLGSSGLPTYNSGGTIAALGNGVYTYTFTKDITNTANTLNGLVYDPTLTHTVAAQIQRTITSPTGSSFQQAVNPYLTFRPDGGVVTITREVVSISACNGCHGSLGLHGGARRDVVLCILCHYPGPTDPTTGQLIDLKSLVHRIHMGENLPSNVAGGDYTIGTSSFKTVAYPFTSGDSFINTTPAECVKCHVAGKDLAGRDYGKDVDKWKNTPTREKCTTCHDLTTFDGSTTIVVKNGATPVTVAAVPHSGGTQADDSGCAGCHPATGLNDYSDVTGSGAPVPSAHLILEKSAVFTGVNFEILSVTNAVAGSAPTVIVKITNDSGTALSPAAAGSSYSLKLGYFSQTDYVNNGMSSYGQPLSQSLTAATANGDGSYTITFATAIPAGKTGTGVIGLEGRATYSVTTPAKGTISPTIGGQAVQYYFDLTTGAQVTDPTTQRRRVVDVDKCKVCHSRLSLHGGSRVNSVQECVICHNPNATDKSRRVTGPFVDGLTERPIDFKVMIHSIHTGENLSTVPYVIYGYGGTANDFSEVRYPNDRRNCLACHIDAAPKTFGLPLTTGVLGTTTATGTTTNDDADNTRTLPIKSVCTSCHDDTITAGHADSKVVSGAETCTQCHTTGLMLGPDYAHYPVR